MSTFRFKLDRKGVGRLAKSQGVTDALHHYADPMADRVKANMSASIDEPDGIDVVLTDHTTDRATVGILVKHPLALLAQAQDGAMTRAASSVGLEVKSR